MRWAAGGLQSPWLYVFICVSHLEVPGDEVQLLIWTQLICHGAGPADEDDTIVMKTDSIVSFFSIYNMSIC